MSSSTITTFRMRIPTDAGPVDGKYIIFSSPGFSHGLMVAYRPDLSGNGYRFYSATRAVETTNLSVKFGPTTYFIPDPMTMIALPAGDDIANLVTIPHDSNDFTASAILLIQLIVHYEDTPWFPYPYTIGADEVLYDPRTGHPFATDLNED